MNREPLHQLIDRLPDVELPAAQRFLEYLASGPAYRAALLAPPDDEPVTPDDAKAIARARADVQAGRVVPQDELVRDFGSG